MKSFKKMFWIISALFIITGAVIFTSCSNDDDEDNTPGSQPSAYSISIATADKAITLAPGSTKTISVTKKGSMSKPAAVNGLTVSVSNSENTITITADSSITEKTEKTVKVQLVEDSSKSVTIAVTVDPNADVTYDTMNLQLNFAENIGAKKVTVKYWDSNEENPAENKIGSVDSEVVNNTATVALSKQYSGSWGFKFSLTVKDSSDAEVKVVVTNPWFEFAKDTTKTFTVVKYVAESKDMTINFSNLGTVAAGTVKYGSSQSDLSVLTTSDMVIAADGRSATVSISSDYCNSDGYFYIAEIKVYSDAGKTTEITGFETTYSAENAWQAFASIAAVTLSKENTDETYSFPYTSETITVASDKTYTKILPASAFKDLTIVYLTVKVSSETTDAWASLSGASTWAEATYWSDCINVEKKINTEDFLNAIKTNGLWMESNAGDFIVTVSYSETADSEENSNTESGETNTGDTNAQEATIATNTEFTMTGANGSTWATDSVLESSAFSDYSNISKIVVSISFASDLTWGSSFKLVAGSSWLDTGSWADGAVTFTVTDSTNISDLISNGVKVGSDYNGKGYATVTVCYATASE